MSELINKLHDVIRSAAYDNICLSFIRLSHGDSTSICNFFQTLLSLIAPERVTCTAEIIDAAHLKKEIKKSISNFDVTIVDSNIILKSKFTKGVKPAVAPRPKSKAKKKKVPLNLPQLSDTSQFSYDSYNISPHQIHEALSFTAYNYWSLDEIHREGYTGKGVNVAVIDTGIDDCHSAFNGTILQPITTCPTNKCSDMTGHGTLCAGILCGKSFLYENSIGNGKVVKQNFPPGVAPDSCLTVCKVTQLDSPQAFMTNMLATLKWIASNNIDVVNISMGSSGFSPEITKAISALVDKGIIVVCSASNHGHKFSQSICFPARLGNVLCIGSHGLHGKPSDFSPVGQEIDFLAPGENITGPSNREYLNGVAIASGTSYAAPAVAGLICLILQFMKENVQLQNLAYLKNHWVMKELLRKMSTSPSRHSDDRGYGVLNPSVFCRNLSESITRICEDLYKEDEQQLS
jgi:subtilisin family serine protease